MQNILKSKIFIGALLTVAVVAVAVVIVINARNPDYDLQAQLDLGDKYVSELDYENAIIAYEAALKIDPYCLEAYLGLSDAYMALGQPDKALEVLEQAKSMLPDDVEIYIYLAQYYASQNQIDLAMLILEEGIQVTDSDRLREMLRGYQTEDEIELAEDSLGSRDYNEQSTVEEQSAETDEETLEESEPRTNNRRQEPAPVIPTLTEEEPVVIPLTTQTYHVNTWNNAPNGGEDSDSQNHGESNHEEPDQSSQTNPLPALPQTGISGNVCGVDGIGIEGVTVSICSALGEVLFSASTDTIGKYVQTLPAGAYSVVLSKEGYVDLNTSISILQNVMASYNYIMLTNEESLQAASLSGIVINATNMQQIEGVTVTLLQGFDRTTSDGQQTTEGNHYAMTENDGTFLMAEGIHAGYYTVEASKDGYSVYQHNETIKPGENVLDINLSPEIQTHGVYRIVLTWGENPRDLDSHLICSGNSNYHVFYGNKNSWDGSASLDWDDTSSYGPETVTVQIEDGNSYIYAVHNFSNSGATPGQSTAWNLANSDARVVVYSDNGIIFDGNVPVSEQGITWEVFRIENGRLIVTNQVSFSHPNVLPNNFAVVMSSDIDDSTPIESALPEEEADVFLQNPLIADIVDGNSAVDDTVDSEMEKAEETIEDSETEEAEETIEDSETEEAEETAGSLETEEAEETAEDSETEEVEETVEVSETEETEKSEEVSEVEEVEETENAVKVETFSEVVQESEVDMNSNATDVLETENEEPERSQNIIESAKVEDNSTDLEDLLVQ